MDATTEALAKLLSKNPDGLLAYYDELAGLFGGMDTYKARSGADRHGDGDLGGARLGSS
jgi:hypothetical protein